MYHGRPSPDAIMRLGTSVVAIVALPLLPVVSGATTIISSVLRCVSKRSYVFAVCNSNAKRAGRVLVATRSMLAMYLTGG